jgi:hypothetical protein
MSVFFPGQIFKNQTIAIPKEETMAFNLRNRNFLKLLDFTPEEIKFLLCQIRWLRKTKSAWQKHRPDIRKSLNSDTYSVRSRGVRSGS